MASNIFLKDAFFFFQEFVFNAKIFKFVCIY